MIKRIFFYSKKMFFIHNNIIFLKKSQENLRKRYIEIRFIIIKRIL